MIRSLCAALVVLAAGAGTLWAGTDGLQAFTSEQARRLAVERDPRVLPEVVLEDQDGVRFTLVEYRGRRVLVDFIYTRCPTLCLAMGSSFQQLYRRFEIQTGEEGPLLLSISFDPQHDTPATLRAYTKRFGADGGRWRFARIENRAQLEALLDVFGVVVIPDGFGGFQHNAAIHLIDRRGRLAGIFDYDRPDVFFKLSP